MPLTNRLDCAVLYRFASSSGLVDRDLGGDLRAEEHLERPQPQDVAVDGGHPVEPPVLRRVGDQLIDFGTVRVDASDQALSELDQLSVAPESALDEPANLVGGKPGVLLGLVEHLERDLASSGSSSHDRLRAGLGFGEFRLQEIIRQAGACRKGQPCGSGRQRYVERLLRGDRD